MAVMKHTLSAHTRLMPAIATVNKHKQASIFTWYRGHRDDVGDSSRVRPFYCASV